MVRTDIMVQADGSAGAGATRQRVFVHLGEPKTGTTALQHTLKAHRVALAEAGFNFPPPGHWRAAQDVLDVVPGPGDPEPPFAGAWKQLVADALAAGHTAILSHEILAYANRDQAQRAMQELRSVETHLILSIRDLASMMTAEWQETIKHRDATPFDRFVAESSVSEAEVPDRHDVVHFWKSHSALDILRDWAGSDIPPEHIHVITLPPPGSPPETLWNRFASVVGIDTTQFPFVPGFANPSLGHVEVEMLRRLNETLPGTFPDWTYQWYVKDLLVQEGFAARTMSPLVRLPVEHEPFMRAETAKLIDGLSAAGYDVVGDIAELAPRMATSTPALPSNASSEAMLEAALYSLTILLTRMEDMRVELNGAILARNGPVKRFLIGRSERHRLLHRARMRYWRYANARKAKRS